MKLTKILLWLGVGILILITAIVIYLYPFFYFFFHTEVEQFDKDLTVIEGGGANSGILVTDSAVVVIDTKMMGGADDLYLMAKERAGHKKIIVINTHFHGDHVKGNHLYTGSKIYIGNYDKSILEREIAPKNMPTDFVKDSLILNLGNETISIFDLGQAHTSNDMVVYLKNHKLLFTGDLVFNKVNPVLKKESQANIDKWINILNIILTKWDITNVVPGHGKPGSKEMVSSLKQYFEDMKTAASNPGKEGELKSKYDDWMKMPFMSSPGKTIDYIRENK